MSQTAEEIATADAAATKKALADMSLSLANLTAEIAKRGASSALESLLGLPANPLASPPGANGKYPALVTSILHPHLLPDVIAQIGRFEFPPAHLGRLLKTFSAAPQAPLLLVMGPNGEAQFMPAEPVPGATALLREVPDILAFTEAWMIFMSVLQNLHVALPIAQGLSAYLNNIVTIARVYPWASVLDYHVAFMHSR
ncbi:hypothetical protein GGX14DRAFT_602238 [Mycena pura]|uniref:Uncharacterized protein n=1 Tax=Mycena pura TaxID=153505 RepID=A0AAD6VR57_9AGAR|nr:hypothetical protein GGX14DRAFT_602238 [Mycena pura]